MDAKTLADQIESRYYGCVPAGGPAAQSPLYEHWELIVKALRAYGERNGDNGGK